jgi:hypothetical protein
LTLNEKPCFVFNLGNLLWLETVEQLRIKYVPIVNKVLAGKETATFFQMDRRVTTLVDLQLASQISLVQEQH